MYGLHVERHRLAYGQSLAKELAEHLARNIYHGKAVVVTDRPKVLLSVIRKQWRKLERSIWKERARTVNPSRITELTNQYIYMQHVTFTAKPPTDILEANITLATADNFVRMGPDCKTMYVTYDFSKEKLHMMTCWMPRSGMVILYGED